MVNLVIVKQKVYLCESLNFLIYEKDFYFTRKYGFAHGRQCEDSSCIGDR